MNSDLLFSNWIFIWFILYLSNIIPYNPKLIILLGFVIIIGILYYLYINNAPTYNLFKFALLNLFMKAIPIVILYNISIKFEDFYFSIGIFIIYLIWLDINDTNFFTIYKKLINNYINGSTNTTISNLYDNIYNNLIDYKK
jgi:hypothetical protein